MFHRIGGHYLVQRVHHAQRTQSGRRYGYGCADAQTRSLPEELGMLLRLGMVVATAMSLAGLLIWAVR